MGCSVTDISGFLRPWFQTIECDLQEDLNSEKNLIFLIQGSTDIRYFTTHYYHALSSLNQHVIVRWYGKFHS